MSTVGSVAVDFNANTKGYVDGLKVIETQTAKTMMGVSKSIGNAGDASERAGDQLEKSFTDANKKVPQLTENINKTTNAIEDMANGLLQLGSAAVLTGIISDASKAAREYENFSMQMTVLLGDAQKARDVIADLNKYSLDTPFSPTQVQKAGRALLSFGITTDKLIPSLKTLGDVSLGTGKDFNELAVLFGKAKVAGVLMAEDLNQFTEAGIPVLEQFAINLGVSASEVKKLGSESKITFDDLVKALNSTEGPMAKYNGMTSEAAKTTDGMLSSFEGNMDEFKKSIGEVYNSILKPLVSVLLDISNGIIAWSKENPALSKTIVEITAALIAMSAAILGTAGIVSAFGVVTAGIKATQASLIAFGASQTLVANQAAMNWAKILGPFALVAAGVFALTYTVNFVERRRVEREEADVSMGTGAALLSSEEQRKNLIPLLKQYQTELNNLKESYNSARESGTAFNDATNKQRQTLLDVNKNIEALGGNLPALAQSLRVATTSNDSLAASQKVLSSVLNEIDPKVKKASDSIKTFGSASTNAKDKAKELSDRLDLAKSSFENINIKTNDLINNSSELQKEYQKELSLINVGIDKKLKDANAIKNQTDRIKEQTKAYSEQIKKLDQLNNKIVVRGEKQAQQSVSPTTAQTTQSVASGGTDLFGSIGALSATGSLGVGASAGPIAMAIQAVLGIIKDVYNTFQEYSIKMKAANLDVIKSIASVGRAVLQNQIQSMQQIYAQQEKDSIAALNRITEAQQEIIDESLEKIKEYNKEKERLISQSNTRIDEENRRAFEAQALLIDEENRLKIESIYKTASDRMQAAIIEQEILQGGEERKQELLQYYASKTEEDKKASDAAIIAQTDQKIQAEETAITNSQKAIEEAQKKHSEEMKAIAKSRALAEYEAGKKTFLIDQATRLLEYSLQQAQAIASYNMGRASALASGNLLALAVMQTMGAGVLSQTLAALEIAKAATVIQQYPPPPVFAEGGMIGGKLHSQGGTHILAEQGEFIVNREATANNLDTLMAINNGKSVGDRIINLSVTNNISGINDIEAIADQIGFSIMQKVKAANYGYI
jgi:tape measure domain-containing protein